MNKVTRLISKYKLALLIFLFLLLPLLYSPRIKALEINFDIITSENIDNLVEIQSWYGVGNSLVAAAFNHSGDLLAIALNDGTIQILEIPSLKIIHLIEKVDREGTWLQFSQNGLRLLFSHWDGMARLWDIESGAVLFEIDPHKSIPSDGIRYHGGNAFDTKLQTVVSLQDGKLTIYEIDSQNKLNLDFPNIISFRIHDSGELLGFNNEEGTLFIYDVPTQEIVYEFISPINSPLTGFGFSPDGNMVWTSWQDWVYSRPENPSIIQFWSLEAGLELYQLEGDGFSYSQIYFDSVNQKVAIAGQDSLLRDVIQVWDLNEDNFIGEAGIPTGGGGASFSPNGQLLATQGGTSPNIHIWNSAVPSRLVYKTLYVGSGPIVPPAFSPSGQFLLTVSGSKIGLWGIEA